MVNKPGVVRIVLAVVLVLSAGGFAVAAHAERAKEAAAASGLSAPEGSAAREAAERGAPTTPTTSPPATTATTAAATATTSSPPTTASTTPTTSNRLVGETLFGVHTESSGTTAAGVAILLVAGAIVLLTGRRWVFVAVALIVAAFAFLDIREALHQHDEARASLVAAAVALAVAHLTASALALVAARANAGATGVPAVETSSG